MAKNRIKQAKPIFMIGFPQSIGVEAFNRDRQAIPQTLKDEYHVLAFMHAGEDFEFMAFYDPDFKEVDLQDLKRTVNEALAQLKS